jgi:predicted lipid-binding transport protein (Tim44 family)
MLAFPSPAPIWDFAKLRDSSASQQRTIGAAECGAVRHRLELSRNDAMKLWLIGAMALALVATGVPSTSEAKRLGGGKPAGMQRNMPARTAPDAPPAKPAAPAQAMPTAPAAAGATPTAATPPKRNWMGPLAGLAAGLGIAALFSHLGMGGAFGGAMGSIFTMLLLAGVAFFAIRFLMRRFGPGANTGTPALAGMGAGAASGNAGGAQVAWPQQQPTAVTPTPMQRNTLDAPVAASTPVGTPASLSSAAGAASAVSDPDAITRAFVPAAFDSESFTRTAKMIFIRLQTANDTADLDDLRRFTTPEMFSSIRLDIQERGATPQTTDVVKVEAEVLDVANEADRQVVSVRFHGQVVEEKGAAPSDFNEVWHLIKPNDDSRSWAIAGIEQLA